MGMGIGDSGSSDGEIYTPGWEKGGSEHGLGSTNERCIATIS